VRGLTRRGGSCIAPGVSRELLQLVFAAGIAEYNLMSRSREDRSELSGPSTPNQECQLAFSSFIQVRIESAE